MYGSALNFVLFGITSTLTEEKLDMSRDAMSEVYQQYKAEPWNMEARKKMAIYSFTSAVLAHKEKRYRFAAVSCYYALSYEPGHLKALRLLEHLKAKRSKELGDVVQKYE